MSGRDIKKTILLSSINVVDCLWSPPDFFGGYNKSLIVTEEYRRSFNVNHLTSRKWMIKQHRFFLYEIEL